MLTLGIETSGRAGTVALLQDGALLGERDLAATGRRHARTLVPEIRQLVDEAGVAFDQVNVIAVSLGPGSFTGLRVGVTCAKTLAYALDCQIVGVPTFAALAERMETSAGRVSVIDDALRGDFYAAEFTAENDVWTCTVPARVIAIEDWRAQLRPNTVVTGPAVKLIAEELPPAVTAADERFRSPRAHEVARLGEAAAGAGRVDDPWTIAPCYLRKSAAEEKREAEQQDQGAAVSPPSS